MSTIVTTHLYQEDLHGNLPANLISCELHTLQTPGIDDYYFIIPRAAPFFVSSLRVFDYDTQEEYEYGTDYTIGHHFIEAMDSIGRPIAGSIRFMRRDITGVIGITYRTLGGDWGFDDTAILRELSQRQYNPITRVWGNIDPLPASFPPLIHDQSLDTLIGSEELDAQLERIGDILASQTAGIDESHLANYNNPHRTTKDHVGLGNVDNFKTATIPETVDGESNTLFTTPRGVYEAIKQQAIVPLTQMFMDSVLDIEITKEMVGLGNVENYPPATTEQAVDISNNEVYLTPYTANLLLQSNTTDPRLEQLILDFQDHLTRRNPHNLTAADVGSLTEQQVLDLILANAQVDKFDGLTAAEWRDLFPLNEDFQALMENLTEHSKINLDVLESNPVSLPTITSKAMIGIKVNYDSYGSYNEDGYSKVIHSNGIIDNTYNAKAFAATENGIYYYIHTEDNKRVETQGSVISHDPVTSEPANIWASNNAVCYLDKETNELYYYDVAGNKTVIKAANNDNKNYVVNLSGNYNYQTSDILGIVSYQDSNDVYHHEAFGSQIWINSFNDIKGLFDGEIVTFALTNDHLTIAFLEQTSPVKIYNINYSSNLMLEESLIDYYVRDDNDEIQTLNDFISQGDEVTCNGIYDTVVFNVGTQLALLSHVDPSAESLQFDIPKRRDHFIVDAKAGNDFVITLDNFNNIDFWGDDPENRLYFNGLRGF